ncbi:MAG: SMP-30/gluconolactonase/LRE family protein [Candidatus Sulfotelmatobacter sp.]
MNSEGISRDKTTKEAWSSIGDIRCELAENPLWHAAEQCLYWTDISKGRIYRYDPNSGITEQVYEGKTVGGFTIQADHTLLLFMAEGAIAQLKHGKLNTLIDGIPEERSSRFNDVIADPRGRVFCGTMRTEEHLGRLYRLDTDGTLHKLLDTVHCSNGLAFSGDLQYLYYTDSHVHAIYRFNYSERTGEITNQELVIRAAEADGYPDGLTLDADGHLWSARWGGGCIIRYSPQHIEERRMELPVKLVSSLTFGGRDFNDIYVTSAQDTELADVDPANGAVFRLRGGIRGVPEFPSRICI